MGLICKKQKEYASVVGTCVGTQRPLSARYDFHKYCHHHHHHHHNNHHPPPPPHHHHHHHHHYSSCSSTLTARTSRTVLRCLTRWKQLQRRWKQPWATSPLKFPLTGRVLVLMFLVRMMTNEEIHYESGSGYLGKKPWPTSPLRSPLTGTVLVLVFLVRMMTNGYWPY